MGVSEAVQETSLVVWNFSELNIEGEAPPTCLNPLTSSRPGSDWPAGEGFPAPSPVPRRAPFEVQQECCDSPGLLSSHRFPEQETEVRKATWPTHSTTHGAAPGGGGGVGLFWVLRGRVSWMNGSHVASLMSRDMFSEATVPWALTPEALQSSEVPSRPPCQQTGAQPGFRPGFSSVISDAGSLLVCLAALGLAPALGISDLHFSMWDPAPGPEIESRPPALGVWNLRP